MLRTAQLAAAQHCALWLCPGLQLPTPRALRAAPRCNGGSAVPHNIPPHLRVVRPAEPPGLCWVMMGFLPTPGTTTSPGGRAGQEPSGFYNGQRRQLPKEGKKGLREKATARSCEAPVPTALLRTPEGRGTLCSQDQALQQQDNQSGVFLGLYSKQRSWKGRTGSHSSAVNRSITQQPLLTRTEPAGPSSCPGGWGGCAQGPPTKLLQMVLACWGLS